MCRLGTCIRGIFTELKLRVRSLIINGLASSVCTTNLSMRAENKGQLTAFNVMAGGLLGTFSVSGRICCTSFG